MEYANYLIALSRGGLAQELNAGPQNGEAHVGKEQQAKVAPSKSAHSPPPESPTSSTIARQTKASVDPGPVGHQSKVDSGPTTNDKITSTDQAGITAANGKSLKHENPQVNPSKEPLKISLASSANGSAETGQIDLTAGNSFRFSKPATVGDGASTPLNIDGTVEKPANVSDSGP